MSPSLAAQRRDHLLAEADAHRATRRVRTRSLVLQRRLPTPFQRLRLLLTNPVATSALRTATAMRFEEPFALAGTPTYPIVQARASLVTPAGKSIAKIAMEVGPWSRTADSDFLLRPDARHPERWSSRHLHRYFAHAHAAADEFTDLLQFAALLLQTRASLPSVVPTD
jgi:hypothetical protein